MFIYAMPLIDYAAITLIACLRRLLRLPPVIDIY